jgi:hypothetical protein
MTTTPPDDVAAMFDLAPAEPTQSTSEAAAAAAAEEAALAAELASLIESGGTAPDAPDSRTVLRVPVSWPGRIRLPDGHVIELMVRNISESGMGLASDEPTPAHTVVDFEMDVPSLDEGGEVTQVKGTIKTTYAVAHGAKILCGGSWVQVPAAALALVNMWGRRLRG